MDGRTFILCLELNIRGRLAQPVDDLRKAQRLCGEIERSKVGQQPAPSFDSLKFAAAGSAIARPAESFQEAGDVAAPVTGRLLCLESRKPFLDAPQHALQLRTASRGIAQHRNADLPEALAAEFGVQQRALAPFRFRSTEKRRA